MTTSVATFHCIMPTLNDKWIIQIENLLSTYCEPDPFICLLSPTPQSNPHLIDEEKKIGEMKWFIEEHDSDSIQILLTSDVKFSTDIPL